MVTNVKEEPKEDLLNCRTVLWYLVFSGFAVNYMIRINLNIGIVSMVKERPKSNESLTSECIPETSLDFQNHSMILLAESQKFSGVGNITGATTELVKEGFDWNEYEQGLILGCFFWLHWTTQVPGGLLANKIGTKLVFGVSNFAGVLFCFLIPTASYMGYHWLIVIRCIQGIVAGFAWPSMHSMTARWIPPNERSKFVTAYLGSSVGAALTFPMCGYIIATWGWKNVFYVSGVLGTIWYVAWYCLVFDSPSEHPRISKTEKEYILDSLGESVAEKKEPVPWRHVLTSVPVLMNVLAQLGGLWGLFTLMTHVPTYLKVIHGSNIKTTGILAGIPHILRMLFAYVFSMFGDYLLTYDKMSRTNVRKLATAICTIGQGFCLLALAYSGCNYTQAVLFLTAATAIHGAVSTGPLASLVDISPNYASILLGLGNGAGVMSGFISPAIVGFLTYKNQTVGQWQKVFWIASGMLFVSGTMYVLFATSDLQPWNSPKKPLEAAIESELVALKKKHPEFDEEEKDTENTKEEIKEKS